MLFWKVVIHDPSGQVVEWSQWVMSTWSQWRSGWKRSPEDAVLKGRHPWPPWPGSSRTQWFIGTWSQWRSGWKRSPKMLLWKVVIHDPSGQEVAGLNGLQLPGVSDVVVESAVQKMLFQKVVTNIAWSQWRSGWKRSPEDAVLRGRHPWPQWSGRSMFSMGYNYLESVT